MRTALKEVNEIQTGFGIILLPIDFLKSKSKMPQIKKVNRIRIGSGIEIELLNSGV